MNAFTVVNRRPTFSTALAAGSVRPQQMLPPGSPLLSHTTSGAIPAPSNPVPSKPVSGIFSFFGGNKSPKVNQSFGPIAVPTQLHTSLPTHATLSISGPLEASLPHMVE